MESWELSAREQIRELVATYAHCADAGRFEELVALFADDGVLETPDGVRHSGPNAIRDFLAATKSRLAEATQRSLIRHNVSNLHITVGSPDEATGVAYFLVITERGVDHWGRYRDRYTCHGGQWRFAHRRVRLEGRSPNSAFAADKPPELR